MKKNLTDLVLILDESGSMHGTEKDVAIVRAKITIEEVKYILSSYYQNTPYNPYGNAPEKGKYRSIGIARTGFMSINQIRSDVPDPLKSIEWICFGSNAFNTVVPFYTNVNKMPKYISEVGLDVSTDNLYWNSRLIGALADAHYGSSIMYIERYQNAVASRGYKLINEYDKKMIESKDYSLINEANEKIADMAKEETTSTLNRVLFDASTKMKNGYNRSDN